MTAEASTPTREEVLSWLRDRRNWGRWGDDDQRGAINLITPEKRVVLAWDLMDAAPNEYGLPWTMHGALFAYGVALFDNALLQPLAEACAEEGRYEFMLTFAPIPVVGGTGSPVNPIALF